jgi:hypothetical protein
MKWMTFRPNYFSFYPPIRDVTAETPSSNVRNEYTGAARIARLNRN